MVARTGHRVSLFEAAHFPRAHIGESLLPASVPILEELGAFSAIEAAGFPRKYGATMVWGRDGQPWSWYFAETSHNYPHSWQVRRAEFDQLLLDNARAAGVEVLEGCRVESVIFSRDRAVGVRYLDSEGQLRTREAGVVIDASGQTALVGNALGLRHFDPAFQNVAVYAYFGGARALPAPNQTNILVEATSNGWLWSIPLGGGLLSTGAVFDGAVGRRSLRRTQLVEILRHEIGQAPHTAALLADATMVVDPVVTRDWSYRSSRLVGKGWVLAGDAACFIDPLFSSGVHLALSAGVLAAAYAVTDLEGDATLAAEAAAVYARLYELQYERFRQMASLFYATNRTTDSAFWRDRRRVLLPTSGPEREAFIRIVAGQPPIGYERSVIERGEPPPWLLDAIRGHETSINERRTSVTAVRAKLAGSVPTLRPDVEVRMTAVPDRARFVRGHALFSTARPEGLPVSALVAQAIGAIDGTRTVSALTEEIRATLSASDPVSIARVVEEAVATLYADGMIARLDFPDGRIL
jgi:flavin-dependent dehydrogenase